MLLAGLILGAAPAQAATVWRIQPAPPGGLDARRNLWVGPDGAFAGLTSSQGSGVFSRAQHWGFRKVGGTIPQPWYQVYNVDSGLCLYKVLNARVPYVPLRRCTVQGPNVVRTDWWQFTSLTNRPQNPGLVQATSAPRVWRIHAFYHGDCLSAPFSEYRVGVRVGVEDCAPGANQTWWLYRASLP